MTEGPVMKIDVNNASFESLVAVDGIGDALAERIIAKRPYASVADLVRVQGISARMAQGWEAVLSAGSGEMEVEALPEEEPAAQVAEEGEEAPMEGDLEEVLIEEEVIEAEVEFPKAETESVEFEEDLEAVPPVIDVFEDEPAPEPAAKEAKAAHPEAVKAQTTEPKKERKAKPASEDKPLLRSEALLYGGLLGLVSILLAVVLALGVLAVVNGGLNFVSPGQLARVERQMETLDSQMGLLRQDIDGLSTRIDSLETLGERVTNLEKAAQTMSENLNMVQSDVAALEQTISGLEEEVDTLTQQYGIFERFLGGMQGLLNELLPDAAPAEAE